MDIAAVRPPKAGYRYVVVSILALVYAFNFMDRQLMGVLAEPIRKDLHLTDTELGLLTGLAFALFYTAFSIVIAWAADRSRRVWIVAAACAIWSLATALCGVAANVVQLVLYRVVVGFGEAGGSPPSYSLISDYFPARERGVALAIYSLGVPIGSMAGAALGAAVAARYGWRDAFVVVGLLGLVAALATFALVREPDRGALDPLAAGALAHEPAPPIGKALAAYLTNRTLVLSAIASGFSAFIGLAMLSWNVPLLIRVKGMDLRQIAAFYSMLLGATGVVGTLASGWLVDKLSHADARWYAWVPAVASAFIVPGLLGVAWAPGWPLTLAFLAAPMALNLIYLPPAIALVQNKVPPAQRTMSSAVLLFIVNLIGLGGGPVYLGAISDHAKAHFGSHSLAIGYLALIPAAVLTLAMHLAVGLSIAGDEKQKRALGAGSSPVRRPAA